MLILKHLCNNLITANIHRCYKIHTIPKTLMMQYLHLLTNNYSHSGFQKSFLKPPFPMVFILKEHASGYNWCIHKSDKTQKLLKAQNVHKKP